MIAKNNWFSFSVLSNPVPVCRLQYNSGTEFSDLILCDLSQSCQFLSSLIVLSCPFMACSSRPIIFHPYPVTYVTYKYTICCSILLYFSVWNEKCYRLTKDAHQMGIVQQKIYTHSDTVHTYSINTETIAHKQNYIPSCIPRNVWTVGLSRISKTS